MSKPSLDDLPGFRRRFIITPEPGWVRAEVEDDFHCMSVTLHHDGKIATAVEPVLRRAPWTTCPGAEAQLEKTFTGVALDAFAARGEKPANCTHLHDLAILGAAHAGDEQPLVYDILVSDPVGGLREAELRRNGETVLRWTLGGIEFVEPVELAGVSLFKMTAWIETRDPAEQEAARVLRWASLIAHGRTIPLDQQSDASRMPPNCYTFQPEMARKAIRVGEIRDFSSGPAQPLDGRTAAIVQASARSRYGQR